MENYRLLIKPTAVKELEDVPLRDRRRIVNRIEALAANPRPVGYQRLSGAHQLRIRQGDYRILYTVDDSEGAVVIVRIAHRREVYRP